MSLATFGTTRAGAAIAWCLHSNDRLRKPSYPVDRDEEWRVGTKQDELMKRKLSEMRKSRFRVKFPSLGARDSPVAISALAVPTNFLALGNKSRKNGFQEGGYE